MFDFGVGYSELFVLAVVAVIVIGPKDLPRVLRTFGQFMNKARGFAREFQGHVDTAMRDVGVADLKKDFDAVKGTMASPLLEGKPAVSAASSMAPYALASPQRDFETYFGGASAVGETHVAGNRVVSG